MDLRGEVPDHAIGRSWDGDSPMFEHLLANLKVPAPAEAGLDPARCVS